MYDRFNREINYLRVSVTDRCNLRCTYCMPESGIKLLKHEDVLTYDEIYLVVEEAVNLGVTKVRLTGGEPLVRKEVIELVRMINNIKGIRDYSMTTNGILLEEFAKPLKDAGLQRVNVSMDTTDPVKYKEITRGGDILRVFKGIESARKAGLKPIKINCVVRKSPEEPDARSVKIYCKKNGLEIRYIPQMNLSSGYFSRVIGGEGGNCDSCNRLRLTANGMIKPCLFNDLEFSIRKLGNREALLQAVNQKPRSGSRNHQGRFYNIGG